MHPSAPAHSPSPLQRHLASAVRQQFVEGLCSGMANVNKAIQDFLTELMSQSGTQREMQERRDAWSHYQKHRAEWVDGTVKALKAALVPVAAAVAPKSMALPELTFSLLSDDVVENKIIASRIALVVLEQVSSSFDALRLRFKGLEGELESTDILRPERLCLLLVEQWIDAGLSRQELQWVTEPLQRSLADVLQGLYPQCTDFLEAQGVAAQQNVHIRAQRPQGGGGAGQGQGHPAQTRMGDLASQALEQSQAVMAAQYPQYPQHQHYPQPPPPPPHPAYPAQRVYPGAASQQRPSGYSQPMPAAPASQFGAPYPLPTAGGAMNPLARARQRANGVMGQLRRFLVQPGSASTVSPLGYPSQPAAPGTGYGYGGSGGGDDGGGDSHYYPDPAAPSPAAPASNALGNALAAHRVQADTFYSAQGSLAPDYSPAAVVQLSGVVRQQSEKLKKTASTDSEKAIIEVVALMFQSILAEDHIPPSVRVWFARLQVPVLRVALAEPEFFSNLNHPARQLIDRMGACVLGFDATAISGGALEAEIRRVVQVIEQYPETGRRVFQLVLDEFEKFLATFLTEKKSTSQLVSVAQQIEQRETLAIQYTIELRTMLKDMPVRDEIRDFLFKFWAEVLALSAVRDGPQHEDTIVFKRTAADLVWAASAKPSRNDRAQVIQGLPALLQRLRDGLALIGVIGAPQDGEIKALTDTLAEAFLSKTASIAPEHIEAMAKRLENLEDFIDEEVMGDFPLDADSVEMMLGIDASSIHVIADNDAPVEEGMVQWANELALGNWFTLDHNGSSARVQYAWHSQRKQLHLFAAVDGSSYLLQLRRLGAYLQAGLLVAQEEEGLTVRATRDALAKLGANPERLLG